MLLVKIHQETRRSERRVFAPGGDAKHALDERREAPESLRQKLPGEVDRAGGFPANPQRGLPCSMLEKGY